MFILVQTLFYFNNTVNIYIKCTQPHFNLFSIGIYMNFQKSKRYSYCVGGKHRSATKNIYGDITSKGSKVLIGYCSYCHRKESLAVSDNTIQAKNLVDFFKNQGKSSV